MKHKVKKIKFKSGYDANKMLVKKLVINFLKNGYLETTEKKAKVLKQTIEKLVSKMKVKNNVNKNYLLKYLGNVDLVKNCFDVIASSLLNVNGGYVRVIKKDLRDGDGSLLARIEWAYPVIKSEVKNSKLNNEPDETNKTNKK